MAFYGDGKHNENMEGVTTPKKSGYFLERNGEQWQSIFPENESHLSQLHQTIGDGINYMVEECGVKNVINIIN